MFQSTRTQLKNIFHEAHIVDLDFAKWDRFVRLVVVASAFPQDRSGRFPLFNIDLLDVSSFAWKSQHIGIELDDDTHHCQWTVFDSHVTYGQEAWHIRLPGLSPAPEITIVCRAVEIEETDNKIVDVVNPSWNKPYAPLARPSLHGLYENELRRRT